MLIILYKVIYIVTAFIAGVITIDLFLKKGKGNRFDRMFSYMSVSFMVWASGRFAMLVSTNHNEALFWSHFLYIGSILVHVFFLHTILILLNRDKYAIHKIVMRLFYLNAVFLLIVNSIYFITGDSFLVSDVVQKSSFNFYEVPDKFYVLHLLNYLIIPFYAIILLINSFRNSVGVERGRLKLIIFSSILGFLGGNSVVPLVYNIPIEPVLLILVPFYLMILSFAITKYKLFDIKVVTTEIFTFILWTFILIRIFISDNPQEQILNILLFILTVVFGIFLIRSVVKEVSLREKVEKLSEEKSEFMSFASHQIKGPLTNFKNATSMMLDGDFGELNPKVREMVVGLYQTALKAIPMVQGFLDVSKMEIGGGMNFKLVPVNVKSLIDTIVTEQKMSADLKKLELVSKFEIGDSVSITVDETKFREVLTNLVDNSIKYTKNGKVEVIVQEENGKIKFLVKDTGMGISKDDLPKIFTKFGRASGAQDINVSSNGLGLYLARQIIEAHKGKIWVESEGSGKGSTFVIEIGKSEKTN